MAVFRWVLALAFVGAAYVTASSLDPLTCDIDMCSPNIAAIGGIYLLGIIAAALVLTVKKR